MAARGHGLFGEDRAPLTERLVGGDEQGAVLVPGADQLEQHAGFGLVLKVSLLAALVQRPDMYILDEPTNHLDTVAVRRLKETLRSLRADGHAILVATHMIDFAATIGDEVTILDRGRVRFSGPLTTVPGDGSLEDRVFAMLEG